MRKLLIIIYLISVSKLTFTQDYYSFPTDSAIWNKVTVSFALNPWEQDHYHTMSYGLFGDTVINEKTYSKLYSGDFCDSSFFDFYRSEYIGGIREDSSRKIYFLKDSIEHILYDFNLNIGDTFNITFEEYMDNEIAIISDIDSILINGEYRKLFFLNSAIEATHPWVEGIGSLTSPIDYFFPYGNFDIHISCFYQNGVLLYYYEGEECCQNSTNANLIEINEINIYPNPTSDYISIDLQDFKDFYEYELIDAKGKRLFTRKINNSILKINLENYCRGFYIIRLKGTNENRNIKVILN